MKFTDGFWMMRPGVTAKYATSVADASVADDRIVLHAPVKPVRQRGDTLNSPLLAVECWSPAEGVIGVRTTHHAGRPAAARSSAWPAPGTAARGRPPATARCSS